MYSMVLMAALATGTDMPDARRGGGGCCGCSGGAYYGGWGGCYGGGGYGRRTAWGGGYGGYAWGGVSPWGGYVYGPMIYRNTPMYAGNVPYANQGTTQSFYYSPPADERAAAILVHLPPDATLTIDDQPTRSTSDTRMFVSPPLEPGETYTYTLRGEVDRDGHKEKAQKTVEVRAGGTFEVFLDFPGLNGRPERIKSPDTKSRPRNPDALPSDENKPLRPPGGTLDPNKPRAPRELSTPPKSL